MNPVLIVPKVDRDRIMLHSNLVPQEHLKGFFLDRKNVQVCTIFALLKKTLKNCENCVVYSQETN